jgi:hypothetical protein
MKDIRLEIIRKHPALAISAYHDGRPPAAVRLKCLDCTNDNPTEVRECVVYLCPLWKRAHKGQTVPVGIIPTREDLQALRKPGRPGAFGRTEDDSEDDSEDGDAPDAEH